MQTTTQERKDTQRCIKRLRSRFERWELSHLRELAASLHNDLEEATSRAISAEHSADMWQELAQQLQEQVASTTGTAPAIGLTQQGELVLIGGAT